MRYSTYVENSGFILTAKPKYAIINLQIEGKNKGKCIMEKRCKNCGSAKLYRNEENWVCSYCGCKMKEEETLNTTTSVARPNNKKADDGYIKGIEIVAVILTILAIMVTVYFVISAVNLAKREMNNFNTASATVSQEETWYQATGPIDKQNIVSTHITQPIVLRGSMSVSDSLGMGSIVQGTLANVSNSTVFDVTVLVYYNGGIMATTIDKIEANSTKSVMLVTKEESVVIEKVVCVLSNDKQYQL